MEYFSGMNNKFISVITASYNNEKTIGETIESVLNQTYNNIEYIIIDGASTDSTLEIIQSYDHLFKKTNIDFKYISEPDNGIYNAWNKALKLTKGEWIVFIGADDYFKHSMTIEKIVPVLNNAKENAIKYVYGKIEHISKNNHPVEIIGKPWQKQREKFTNIMNIGHSGSFNHRSLFEIYGNFNDEFKIAGDYEFLLREFKNKTRSAFFYDEITIVMREGGISGSLTNRLLLIRESYKAREINGINAFSLELFFWETKVRAMHIISKVIGYKKASNMADLYRMALGKNKRWSN